MQSQPNSLGNVRFTTWRVEVYPSDYCEEMRATVVRPSRSSHTGRICSHLHDWPIRAAAANARGHAAGSEKGA